MLLLQCRKAEAILYPKAPSHYSLSPGRSPDTSPVPQRRATALAAAEGSKESSPAASKDGSPSGSPFLGAASSRPLLGMYETELPDELLRDTAMFKLFERRLAWVRSLHLYSQATALTDRALQYPRRGRGARRRQRRQPRSGGGVPARPPPRPRGRRGRGGAARRIVRIRRGGGGTRRAPEARAAVARRGALADMHAAMVAQARRQASSAHLVQLPLVGLAPPRPVASRKRCTRRKTRVSLTTGDAAGGLALQRASRRLSAVTALAGTIRTSLSAMPPSAAAPTTAAPPRRYRQRREDQRRTLSIVSLVQLMQMNVTARPAAPKGSALFSKEEVRATLDAARRMMRQLDEMVVKGPMVDGRVVSRDL